jgi:putative Holliday junction resolvase
MDAIVASDDGEKVEKICLLVHKNKIGEIVMGYPLNMDGTSGAKAKEVDNFIGKLSKKLSGDVKITVMDERLTSEQAMDLGKAFHPKQSPAKKRKHRRRGTTDSVAALVILQDFLQDFLRSRGESAQAQDS